MMRSKYLCFCDYFLYKRLFVYFCVLSCLAGRVLSEERFIVYVGPFLNESPVGSALMEESTQGNIQEFRLITSIQNDLTQAGINPSLQYLSLQSSLPEFVTALNSRAVTITETSKLKSPDIGLRQTQKKLSLESTIAVEWLDVFNASNKVQFTMNSLDQVPSKTHYYSFNLIASANIRGRVASFNSVISLYVPFSFRDMSLFRCPHQDLLLANPRLWQITPMTIIPYLHSSEFWLSSGARVPSEPYQFLVTHSLFRENFRDKQIVTEYLDASPGTHSISSIGYMTGDPGTELAGQFLGWRLCSYDRTHCMVYFRSNDIDKQQRRRVAKDILQPSQPHGKHLRQKSSSNPNVVKPQENLGAQRPRSQSLQPDKPPSPVYVSLVASACESVLGVVLDFYQEKTQNQIVDKLGYVACNLLTQIVFDSYQS